MPWAYMESVYDWDETLKKLKYLVPLLVFLFKIQNKLHQANSLNSGIKSISHTPEHITFLLCEMNNSGNGV